MDKTFIIGEIGINHNGNLKIAKELIDWAVLSGADAVKFQKRTIEKVYTKEELDFAAQISGAAGLDNGGTYFSGLEPLEEEPVRLSIGTDVSDVSHTVPTVMLSAAAMCKGTPLHHWAATAQAGMSIGKKGMLYAAECMALGCVRLVQEPKLLEQVWKEHGGAANL